MIFFVKKRKEKMKKKNGNNKCEIQMMLLF